MAEAFTPGDERRQAAERRSGSNPANQWNNHNGLLICNMAAVKLEKMHTS
jgi:hypothetical protein